MLQPLSDELYFLVVYLEQNDITLVEGCDQECDYYVICKLKSDAKCNIVFL